MNAAEVTSRSGHQIQKLSSGYFCGDLKIERVQNDELLAYFYSKIKQEGRLDAVYPDGAITLLDFIVRYLQPDRVTLGVFLRKEDQALLVGLGWVNSIVQMGPDHARADLGMAFLRESESQDNRLMAAQMMIQWAFDHLDIDVVCGMTPAPNRAAVWFSQTLGFQVIGPLDGHTVWKGELAAVYLSSMTKSRWESLNPWKEG